jgi:hypothetical protein
MNKGEMQIKILRTLESQRFADWYRKGKFDRWITEGDVTREEILNEIDKIFNLKGEDF